jgi:hypothetical protein
LLALMSFVAAIPQLRDRGWIPAYAGMTRSRVSCPRRRASTARIRRVVPAPIRLGLAGILFGVAMWAGCGGGSSSNIVHNAGTPKGNYNLTVAATYTSGSTTVTHNITLTLTVN